MINCLYMKKKIFFIWLLFYVPTFVSGQTCNCEENFKWVKRIFEENDAGFDHVVKQKGQYAYDLLNRETEQKSKSVTTLIGCQSLVYEWSAFFRVGHFSFSILNNEKVPNPTVDPILIKKQPVLKIDLKKFEKRINSLQSSTVEGVWTDGTYKVGINKTTDGYQGFIIEAQGTLWTANQLKFIISKDKKTADLWMRNFSKNTGLKVEFIGNNTIKLGDVMYLRRISKNFEDSPSIKNYIKFLYATNEPYFQQLSENITYIRIPSFDLSFKRDIDSILTENRYFIEKTNNLIIDIRNNGGGTDVSYSMLIPFLYTNPIRTIGLRFRSTELNNNLMLWLSENENFDEEQRKEFKKAYVKLNSHPGEFVNISPGIVSKDSLGSVLSLPKNVAVIINGGNASTAEQFLLAAKQSKKVKLFGTVTMGALDVSNMNDAISPDGNFELSFCRSISYRIPNMAIDGVGIQPDYYLDESIPESDWVSHVQKLLEQ